MEARKLLALIVCGLIAVVSSGCTVKTVPTEVELDSVETLKPGQEISVTTNKRILIYEGKETFYFDLVITDVNAERIQGNLTSLRYVNGDLPDGIVQVEVKIDDIAYIHLMRKDDFGIKSLVEPAGLVLQLVLAMLLVGLVLGI